MSSASKPKANLQELLRKARKQPLKRQPTVMALLEHCAAEEPGERPACKFDVLPSFISWCVLRAS